MVIASIPSPDQGSWQLGFFELRAYALCIIAGVLVAVWLGNRRWVARGGQPGTVADIAVWAVPFGLVGARLYHVLTDYQLYFCSGCDPVEALYIWRGGLGIWGAVALGAVGAYIGCRRRGVRFLAFGDAIMPAIAVAQGIGRFGNWFNQELFGRPTSLPWALEIDPAFRPAGFLRYETFHPTFLYEAVWDFGVAGLVIWADRRFRLGYGRAIALYVMAYTAGRGWIEYLRIDEANHILGMRLNVWTSVIVFIGGLVFFIWSARRHPGREQDVEPVPAAAGAGAPAPESGAASNGGTATADEPAGAGEDPAAGAEERDDPDPVAAEDTATGARAVAEPVVPYPPLGERAATSLDARGANAEEPPAEESSAEAPAADDPAGEDPAAEDAGATAEDEAAAQRQARADEAAADDDAADEAARRRRGVFGRRRRGRR